MKWDTKDMAVMMTFMVCVTVLGCFGAYFGSDQEPLTCQPGYATEYTATGHKFCRLILPDCKKE